ncbi:hypothetical protein CMT41_07085 [Colwellia sp. MT41]|nr:hypothetical protein CMT41_07085 [Colwellia sp. MT41]
MRADEQKHHMRRRLEVSWHKTTKPRDLMATVNDAAVQRKCMLLSGEICLTRDHQATSMALVNKCLGFWRSSSQKSEPMKTIAHD